MLAALVVAQPYLAFAIAGVQFLASAGPTTTDTLISSNNVTDTHQLDTTSTFTRGAATTEKTGPGRGDVILLFRNVKLVWLFDQGEVRLAVLGAEAIQRFSCTVLQADLAAMSAPTPTNTPGIPARLFLGPVTQLPSATIQMLLSLDPFVVTGPDASLGSPRFQREQSEGAAGASLPLSVSVAVTDTGTTTTINTETTIEDVKPGFLSFLGVGPSSESITKTTLTHSESVAKRTGKTITEQVNFTPSPGMPDAPYFVEVYYDRIFGTLAFKRTTAAGH